MSLSAVMLELSLFFLNDESRCDRNKEPWSIPNLKRYLNLEYVKLDDLTKFCAAYFAALVDYCRSGVILHVELDQ